MRHRLLLALCGVACAATVWAHDFTYTYQGKTLAYQIESENTCAVTDPDGVEFDRTGALVIPSTVSHDGVTYTVTAIAEYSNCGVGYTSVEFPSSVREVRFCAFNSCPNLTTLTFKGETPSSNYCFVESPISKINSPYLSADGRCVVSPEGNLDLCVLTGLTSYSFPEGIRYFPGMLLGWEDITQLTLPESTEYIDAYFLSTFPNLSRLDGKCVADDHRTIVLEDGTMTFAIYKGLTSYTVPEGVTYIDYMASFGGNEMIESLTLPSSINKVHCQYYSGTFPSLKYVYGPFSTEDGKTAKLPEDGKVTLIANVKGLEEYTVPSDVDKLRNYALLEKDRLRSIYCNHYIDEMDLNALVRPSEQPLDLYLSQTTPPMLFFGGAECMAHIYIPYGSMANYRAAEGWSEVSNLYEYVPGFSLKADERVLNKHGRTEITVELENVEDVTALQLDVTLPDGLWVDAMDESVITPSERLAAHTVIAHGVDERTLRVVIYSASNAPIGGNEGPLLTLAVNTGEWLESYSRMPVVLSNVEATCVNNLREQAIPDWTAWQTVGADYAVGYALRIDDQEISKHGTTPVAVMLDNAEDVIAAQFDVRLPDGLYLDTVDDDYDIRRSDRMDRSFAISSADVDGVVRVVFYSSSNKPLSGNDGCVLTLPVKAENWVEEYTSLPVSLTNIMVTRERDKAQLYLPESTAWLTTGAAALAGDANGDGGVTITDVTYIVACIMEQPMPNTVFEAADANGDGSVTVTDITHTIDIILSLPAY